MSGGYKSTCPINVALCDEANRCDTCANELCGYCQNTGSSVCGENDCMSCVNSSYELVIVYTDGTGYCNPISSFISGM